MPKTKFGKWSLVCIGLFFFFFLFVQVLRAFGQEAGDTFFNNPLFSIPALLTLVSGVLAFVFGLYSIIKQKERSTLVFIAAFIGLLILAFTAGELFGPAH